MRRRASSDSSWSISSKAARQEDADRAPDERQPGDQEAGKRIRLTASEQRARRDAGEHAIRLESEIGEVVHAVSLDGDRLGATQRPRLGGDEAGREQDRERHNRKAPALVGQPVRRDEARNRLFGDQGAGGEHQAGLGQAGERFCLPVAVPMLAIGGARRIADGEEGDHGRQHVQAGVLASEASIATEPDKTHATALTAVSATATPTESRVTCRVSADARSSESAEGRAAVIGGRAVVGGR